MDKSQPPPGESASDRAQADHDDALGFELPAPAQPGRNKTLLALLVLALGLGVAFSAGYLPKLRARGVLERESTRSSAEVRSVEVMLPKRLDGAHNLQLPASVRPLAQTTLYPRADGYVKAFYKDLGEHVDSGEVLALIDTPELDQQLLSARASLLQAEASAAQAKASRDLAHVNLARYRVLKPAGVASQQELDQYAAQAVVDDANVQAAEAAIEAQRANLQRLLKLKSFARVTAPFAGIVSARSVEVGSLVTAGNGTPLFEVSASDPVRVFVEVPQDVAPSIRTGRPAKVHVREFPDRVFEGTISFAAGVLNPETRTMRTEVRVPNKDGALIAGMYAEVALDLSVAHVVFELPAAALIINADGVRVATVGADQRVRFVPVVVERDAGATIQIASGLRGDEHVVTLGAAALRDGDLVRAQLIAPEPPSKK
jgi:RND family efflux transporter MFP subunit